MGADRQRVEPDPESRVPVNAPALLAGGTGESVDVPGVRETGGAVVSVAVHRPALALHGLSDERATRRLKRLWRAAMSGPVKPDWESIARGQRSASLAMRKHD